LRDFDQTISLKPNWAGAHVRRAVALARKKDKSMADAELNSILEPDIRPLESAFNSVAWVRATSPDDSLRDGKRAIEESTKACELTHWNNFGYIDTLAAAYAEAGDFDNAIKYEQESLDKTSLQNPAHGRMLQRLTLYHEHKPYREKLTDP
jgi:tetratricopeptide (TPR) repeat protein